MTYETGEIGTQKNIAIFGIGDHWGAVGMAGSCWSLNPLEGQLHFVPPHALNQIETATLFEPCWSSILIDPIDVFSCFFKCVFIYFKYLGHLRPSLIWKLVASFPSLLTWPLHEFFHSAKLFRSAFQQGQEFHRVSRVHHLFGDDLHPVLCVPGVWKRHARIRRMMRTVPWKKILGKLQHDTWIHLAWTGHGLVPHMRRGLRHQRLARKIKWCLQQIMTWRNCVLPPELASSG